MTVQATDASTPARAAAVRHFGRLQLLRLLGKSQRTMAWRVADPRTGQDLVLVLPRVQPPDDAALQRWQTVMRQASRLSHPHLAAVIELGVQDGWPYAAYDPVDSATLGERITAKGLPGVQAAQLSSQVLSGLAYAHEAGLAHHDLQPFLLLVSESGALRVAGLGVASEMAAMEAADPREPREPRESRKSHAEPGALREQRDAAERDVLCAGVLLHGLLAGQPALEEADIGRVVLRLPPRGRDIVRLPWTLPQPVAEPLRAIVNRATERQERQRYRNARTLLRALEGWLQTDDGSGGGPLALLSDRLRTAGVLPSAPEAAARVARLALMERERTNELADVVLQDLALAFELLRLVNSAQVRGAQVAGSGPVLTVRRAVAMLGLDGVRRAALALRPWPGPLAEAPAGELQALMDRCKRAGRVALALRPAGYDGEVVYLITLLQNLGRLVVHYHFADEAQQVRRLMQPAPSPREGEPEDPGMSEEGASFAVLGADIEAIGAAVARQWGLGDAVLAMIRRLPLATPVRSIDSDDDLLRSVASCANEVLDALALPAARVVPAMQRIVQRYGRTLNISLRDVQAALQDGSTVPVSAGNPVTQAAPLEAEDASGAAAPTAPTPPAAPGRLRAAASAARAAP